jgi:hypothetical protein
VAWYNGYIKRRKKMNVMDVDIKVLKSLLRKSGHRTSARLLADAGFRHIDEEGVYVYAADFYDKGEILDSGWIYVKYDPITCKLSAR